MLRLKEGWPRCDKTGWLSKQAYDSDEWKRVWVVLKGCLLLLFEDATVRWSAKAGQLLVPFGLLLPSQTLPRIDILLATPDDLTVLYGVQEVRPLEVVNVLQASVSELSLQDAWRAEFSRHSKGLLIKVGNWCWPDFKCKVLDIFAWLLTSLLVCSSARRQVHQKK